MKDLVLASLLSAPLSPGQPLRVGVELRVKPGWHIYWRNPGESGLATWVELRPPAGWTVGPLLLPGPEAFDMPGGIVNYGHSGTVTLLLDLQPGPGPTEGALVEGKVGWLACTDALCVPGEAALRLVLDADGQGDLAPATAALPRPLPAGARQPAAPGRVDLRFAGAKALRFFPEVESEGLVTVQPGGEGALGLILAPGAPERLGLVRVEAGQGPPVWYEVGRSP
jgi:thiol:disulfide interchange protein DsbD